ncbi:hypothetical protein SanaruYs_05930 [Chryseotalea sanaruensis]|uniref:DUF1761 domain-containing protein n=1 Tax=Chryseotalea sanaruensis TaxID=2482724 RepID=A0A401U621_9BACT|nr:hypothetical protein [Chryseotalea sanaruensis]GCC50378.1 hypothetical protein SanaruYs_05930 [Chryseotalea sanaruensis]
MKKIILIGLAGGILVLVIGMLTGKIYEVLAPSIKTEFQNTNLFRPWIDPIMSLYFVHPFLLGIILAWVWSKVNPVISADTDLKKGLWFGLFVWMAATLPGMLISYASFPISLLMIIAWTISALLELLCLGILFSKTLK